MGTKLPKENKSMSYKDSGVDVEAGYKLINKIKPFIKVRVLVLFLL